MPSQRFHRWPDGFWTRASSGSLAAKLAAERRCRLCERTAEQRNVTKHRLVPGRLGGRYVAANVVPLCWPCHASVEASRETRRMLRPLLWPEEIAHVIARLGEPWLDRTYPRPAASRVVERNLEGRQSA